MPYPRNTEEDDFFADDEDAQVEGAMNVLNGTSTSQLKSVIERIERLEEDKAAIMLDLKEVYSEAKGNGFDVKILKKVVALRKKDPTKLAEEEAVLDLYMSAL